MEKSKEKQGWRAKGEIIGNRIVKRHHAWCEREADSQVNGTDRRAHGTYHWGYWSALLTHIYLPATVFPPLLATLTWGKLFHCCYSSLAWPGWISWISLMHWFLFHRGVCESYTFVRKSTVTTALLLNIDKTVKVCFYTFYIKFYWETFGSWHSRWLLKLI